MSTSINPMIEETMNTVEKIKTIGCSLTEKGILNDWQKVQMARAIDAYHEGSELKRVELYLSLALKEEKDISKEPWSVDNTKKPAKLVSIDRMMRFPEEEHLKI